MMCRFVGLVGHAGSGKDTVAYYLTNAHGYKRLAFAESMKYYYGIQKGYKGTRDEVIAQVNANKNREELISFGMSWRDIDEDIWVKELDRRVKRVERFYADLGFPLPRFVITDVRFDNELDLIRHKYHGIIIKVSAPLDVRLERMKRRGDVVRDLAFMNHESEQLADKITPDFIVDNSGSLADLACQMADIMQRIR